MRSKCCRCHLNQLIGGMCTHTLFKGKQESGRVGWEQEAQWVGQSQALLKSTNRGPPSRGTKKALLLRLFLAENEGEGRGEEKQRPASRYSGVMEHISSHRAACVRVQSGGNGEVAKGGGGAVRWSGRRRGVCVYASVCLVGTRGGAKASQGDSGDDSKQRRQALRVGGR